MSILDHPAVPALRAAWDAPDNPARVAALGGVVAPGPLPLRSRYLHLLDEEAPPGPWQAGDWAAIIALEDEGDAAIRRNDAERARNVCGRLLTLEPDPAHRLVTVHAHTGLGDIGLAANDGETAAQEYEAALAAALADHYRFGQLKPLVGLGYVTLMFHSAGTAIDRFREAARLAREVGDPLFVSNALLGVAECEERSGDLESAAAHAREAYDAMAGTGSPLGVGNAAQRLGAMLHRLRRTAEARQWYERARDAFEQAGNPMGLTNTLSGLGDVLMDEDGDFDAAERAYAAALDVARQAELSLSAAHALQDLARISRARGDWAAAVTGFERSLAAYIEVGDLLGMTNALDKLAEAHDRLGQEGEALATRMRAVFEIEEYRATHSDDRSQAEYQRRFRRVYSQALNASVDAGSAASFAVVADCLAGRRLAGLFAETARASATGELSLLQEMITHADQRLVSHRRARRTPAPGPRDPSPEARRRRLIQLLGAVGVRHGLADRAEASLDDLLAAVYLPPADEGDALLAALPANCHVLQILIDPAADGRDRACWLWRDPAGTVQLGATELDSDLTGLIATLQGDSDERAELLIRDLRPLSALLPEGLRATLAAGPRPTIIIPVGELWPIPWGAVPVTAPDPGAPDPDSAVTVLGELAPYVVCPSLTVQRRLAERGAPPPVSAPGTASLWRSPQVRAHEFPSFLASPRWRVTQLPSAGDAKRHLTDSGSDDAIVITGHGRPVPGLGHYLELDAGQWLLPVDLIGAKPPLRLLMVACWGGAIPDRSPSDPLSLATLALAARTAELAATVGELADSPPASDFVERILANLATMPLPGAVHAATRWFLSDEHDRAERVHHWAPLVPFGTIY
jgi:tetratricopeptide (TPR) repeat protein